MNYKSHLAITGLLFKVMTLKGAYCDDLNLFIICCLLHKIMVTGLTT